MLWESVKKRWKFWNGPMFDVGDRVIVKDAGAYLKLPRKVKIIGWNNTKGHFFYYVAGIKDKLFQEDELSLYVQQMGKLFLLEKTKKDEKNVLL